MTNPAHEMRKLTTPVPANTIYKVRNGQEWMLAGICSTMDQEEVDATFFVDRGEGARKAKTICRNCPLQKRCSQYAINYPTELDGIWGGTTVRERRKLRKLFGIKQERVVNTLGDRNLANAIVQ